MDLLTQLLLVHITCIRVERIVIHGLGAPARSNTLRLALVLVQVGRFFVVADDVVALKDLGATLADGTRPGTSKSSVAHSILVSVLVGVVTVHDVLGI